MTTCRNRMLGKNAGRFPHWLVGVFFVSPHAKILNGGILATLEGDIQEF